MRITTEKILNQLCVELAAQEEELRNYQFVLSILLKRHSNMLTISPWELAEADSDDVITVTQEWDRSWVVRRREDVELEVSTKEGPEVRISDEKLGDGV